MRRGFWFILAGLVFLAMVVGIAILINTPQVVEIRATLFPTEPPYTLLERTPVEGISWVVLRYWEEAGRRYIEGPTYTKQLEYNDRVVHDAINMDCFAENVGGTFIVHLDEAGCILP